MKDYLKKRDFSMLQFSSDFRFNEPQAIWSNYRRMDIELFEELLIIHDIIYYYLLFPITN